MGKQTKIRKCRNYIFCKLRRFIMLSITWTMPEWVSSLQRGNNGNLKIEDEKNSEFFRKLSAMNQEAQKRALVSEPLDIDGVFKISE